MFLIALFFYVVLHLLFRNRLVVVAGKYTLNKVSNRSDSLSITCHPLNFSFHARFETPSFHVSRVCSSFITSTSSSYLGNHFFFYTHPYTHRSPRSVMGELVLLNIILATVCMHHFVLDGFFQTGNKLCSLLQTRCLFAQEAFGISCLASQHIHKSLCTCVVCYF